MKAKTICLATVVATFGLLSAFSLAAQVDVRPQIVSPKIDTRSERSPVSAAPANRIAAVLRLELQVKDGRTLNARVLSFQRVRSYAPKVYARSAGDWLVTLSGEKRASFYMPDPATDIEVENGPNDRSPYSQVKVSGVIEDVLVVPLYGPDGAYLAPTDISIVDARTDRAILKAPLRPNN